MLANEESTVAKTIDSIIYQLQEGNFNSENDNRDGIYENNLRARSRNGSSSKSSSVVDYNPQVCEGRQRNSAEGRNATMAYLADKFPDVFREMEPLIKEMASEFLDYFCGEVATSSRRYVSDVFVPTNNGQIGAILELLRDCGYGHLLR